MSYVRDSERNRAIPQLQDMVKMTQAAPAQNTWYTMIDVKGNLEMFNVSIVTGASVETIEVRFTIDGLAVAPFAFPSVAGGGNYNFSIYPYLSPLTVGFLKDAAASVSPLQLLATYMSIKCKSFKAEMRKTTAVGADAFNSYVVYAKS